MPADFEPMLPSGAVFYARLTGVDHVWSKLETTQLVKQTRDALQKIRAAVENQDAFSKPSNEFKEWEAALGTTINTAFFANLFGKKSEFGVYLKPDGKEGDAVLVTDPKSRTQVESLIDHFLQKTPEITRQSQSVDGLDIFVLSETNASNSAEPRNICYTFTKEACIFSTSLDRVSALARGKRDGNLMAHAPELRDLPDAGTSFALVILDMNQIATVIQTSAQQSGEDVDPSLAANLAMLRSQGPIVFTSSYSQGLLRIRTKSTLSPNADTKLREAIMSVKRDPEGFKWLPKDVIMFFGATIPIEKTLRMALESGQDDQSFVTGLLQEFSKGLGVDLEKDLLPLLGDEYLVSITGVDFGGAFPVPQLAVLLEVKDDDKMAGLMDKIIQSPTLEFLKRRNMKFKRETVDGVDLNYLPLPFGENLAPGYTVEDDLLIIGTSKNTISHVAQAIDAGEDVRATNRTLEAMTLGHVQKPNNYIFFDNAQFMTAAIKAFNNYRLFIPPTIPVDAVEELMQGLKNLESVYATVMIDGDVTKGTCDLRIR